MVLPIVLLAISAITFSNAAASTTTRNPSDDLPIVTSCIRRFVNENGKSVSESYQCPEYDQSPEKTLCCDKTTDRCCLAPKGEKSFLELPQYLAIIISIAAILAVALITGVMIMCCCWERCPLYMACRAEAKPDYIAKPDDVAGLSLMPGDNMEDAKMYEPGKASSKGIY